MSVSSSASVSPRRSGSVSSLASAASSLRRLLQVVGGQVGQQVAGEVDAVLLVGGLVVRDAGLDAVRVRPAEVLEAHVLAGHRLDHVGAGDEHVAGALDHEGEVGDGRGVDRAARARAHDQRDLRHHAGGHHVAVEDLGEQAERDHALLDAGAAAVVDPDDRAAGLQRVIHDLDDLLAVDLAERAAEHGEVLAEHADRASVHGPVPGDHAVAVGPVGLDAEVVRPVPGQLVELGERARVEQHDRSAPCAVFLPRSCCLATACSEPACTASCRRRSRSASLPAVVCGSGPVSAACVVMRIRLAGRSPRRIKL